MAWVSSHLCTIDGVVNSLSSDTSKHNSHNASETVHLFVNCAAAHALVETSAARYIYTFLCPYGKYLCQTCSEVDGRRLCVEGRAYRAGSVSSLRLKVSTDTQRRIRKARRYLGSAKKIANHGRTSGIAKTRLPIAETDPVLDSIPGTAARLSPLVVTNSCMTAARIVRWRFKHWPGEFGKGRASSIGLSSGVVFAVPLVACGIGTGAIDAILKVNFGQAGSDRPREEYKSPFVAVVDQGSRKGLIKGMT